MLLRQILEEVNTGEVGMAFTWLKEKGFKHTYLDSYAWALKLTDHINRTGGVMLKGVKIPQLPKHPKPIGTDLLIYDEKKAYPDSSKYYNWLKKPIPRWDSNVGIAYEYDPDQEGL